MAGTQRLNVFQFHSPNQKHDNNEGWQYAPMHMIFVVKQQDLRYKARLVIGGHVVDSSKYNTYSSVVENLSVRLVFLAAAHQGLDTCKMSAPESTEFANGKSMSSFFHAI